MTSPLLPLTPTRLRQLLIGFLFLIAVACGGSFYLAINMLRTMSVDVSHSTSDALASNDNIETLKKLKQQLDTQKSIIERADTVLVDTSSYTYQNQIINTLNAYAARWGITLSNITFGSTAPPAAAPKSAATPETTSSSAAVASSKKVDVSVTVKSPTNYYNLLNFLNSINHNLTKMEIGSINLTKGNTNGSDVSSDVINISVYKR